MRKICLVAIVALGAGRAVLAATGHYEGYEAFTTDYPPVYSIAGYDSLSRLEIFRPFDGEGKSFSFERPEGVYTITWQQTPAHIVIGRAGQAKLTIAMEPVVARVEKFLHEHAGTSPRAVPQAALTYEAEGEGLKAKLYFDDLSLRREHGALTLYHFKADLLLKSSDTPTKR